MYMIFVVFCFFFFFSSRRRHTRWPRDWSSDVCSSDLEQFAELAIYAFRLATGRAPTERELSKLLGFWDEQYKYFEERTGEIGRASCRERVEIWGVDG